MTFKELCNQYAEGKAVQTMLIMTEEEHVYGDTITHYHWILYLTSDEKTIPIHLEYRIKVQNDTTRHTIYCNHTVPFPSYKVVKWVEDFNKRVKEWVEKELLYKDKDRIRKIVSDKISSMICNSNDLSTAYIVKSVETEQPFTTEELDNLLTMIAYKQLFLEVPKKEEQTKQNHVALILYGERGKQLAQGMKDRGLMDMRYLDEKSVLINFIFPFAKKKDVHQLQQAYIHLLGDTTNFRNAICSLKVDRNDIEDYL